MLRALGGSEWKGVSVALYGPSVASLDHSATQTSVCRRASSAGMRTYCSRSPRCAL